jgi:hypothetical protein
VLSWSGFHVSENEEFVKISLFLLFVVSRDDKKFFSRDLENFGIRILVIACYFLSYSFVFVWMCMLSIRICNYARNLTRWKDKLKSKTQFGVDFIVKEKKNTIADESKKRTEPSVIKKLVTGSVEVIAEHFPHDNCFSSIFVIVDSLSFTIQNVHRSQQSSL